ncbi:hypothetical protein JOF29_005367 [Kribbella aluminosa]|uniref:Uncharacterized protein n=1 Tax=Kribbella aluminosa TaxID=416017 RepID=A0ABS4URI9_9ACTN|nr:hypothetical protein [Kribbella aluminosa]
MGDPTRVRAGDNGEVSLSDLLGTTDVEPIVRYVVHSHVR